MISVLFNVFSSCASEERGLVGEVIKAWLGVLSSQVIISGHSRYDMILMRRLQDIAATYAKVTGMLQDALKKPSTPSSRAVPVSHTTLDLLLLLLPFLSLASLQTLFEIALSKELMESSDAGVQKKSYRILSRLVEQGILQGKKNIIEHVVKRIGETVESVSQGSKRVCCIPYSERKRRN
jgi:ribosomal RNA-processing protein 12